MKSLNVLDAFSFPGCIKSSKFEKFYEFSHADDEENGAPQKQ